MRTFRRANQPCWWMRWYLLTPMMLSRTSSLPITRNGSRRLDQLSNKAFSRQGEVLVQVGRYILWGQGGVNTARMQPAVQRLQKFGG